MKVWRIQKEMYVCMLLCMDTCGRMCEWVGGVRVGLMYVWMNGRTNGWID